MANEIQAIGPSGKTLYAVVLSESGQAWNATTPAFETINSFNWAHYVLALGEQSGSGIYLGSFPTAITQSGQYAVAVYIQQPGGPSPGDMLLNAGLMQWSGSVSESLPGTVAAIIAHGDANWTEPSDGDVAVDHNTGGTDALRYMAGIAGVEAAVIRAYLKSDYLASAYVVRAQSVTGPDGRWLEPMYLAAGQHYTLVFEKPGDYGPDKTDVTP